MKKIFSFLFSLIILCGISTASICTQAGFSYEQKEKDAEDLYMKIHNFLDNYKNYSPENFEDACHQYLLDCWQSPVILDKKEFKSKSANKLVLYRGVSDEKYADDFKNGEIFIGKIAYNQRGQGIYTSDMKSVAEAFANNHHYCYNNKNKILKMFFKKGCKILKNSYLEELKNIIKNKHPNEFTDFYNIDLNGYYTDNSSALFNNSGILARFLGYDILVSEYSPKQAYSLSDSSMEYLVINPGILIICK